MTANKLIQKMHPLQKVFTYFLVIVLMCPASHASLENRVVMARSPESSAQEFAQALERRNQLMSFAESQQVRPPKEVSFAGTSASLEESLREVEKGPMNSADTISLLALLVRSMEMDLAKDAHRWRAHSLFTLRPELQGDFPQAWSSLQTWVATKKLTPESALDIRQWMAESRLRRDLSDAVLMVDGTRISEENLPELPATPRHWQIVSNVYRPFVSIGSFADFRKAARVAEDLGNPGLLAVLSGDCRDPRIREPVLGFFGPKCIVTGVDSVSQVSTPQPVALPPPAPVGSTQVHDPFFENRYPGWLPWAIGFAASALVLSAASGGKRIEVRKPF